MNRIIHLSPLMFAALLALSLPGCGKQDKKATAQPTAPAPATTTAPAAPDQQAPVSQPAAVAAAQPPIPKNPLEDRYTAQFKQCMSSGDAAQGVTTAMVDCIGAEHDVQDAKLNQTYKTTMAALDPDQQIKLRDAQRVWIKYRDSKCDAENQTGGTQDLIGRADCALTMTIQRTIELENMQQP